MKDTKIVVTILLALIAFGAGAVALAMLVQTLSGLGAGGLAFTAIPILVLGGVSALCIYGIKPMNR